MWTKICMLCLNLGTFCEIQMCLNSGISSASILKQNDANVQAVIDKSLDDVLPKFRQQLKFTFCTSLRILLGAAHEGVDDFNLHRDILDLLHKRGVTFMMVTGKHKPCLHNSCQ